MTLASFLLCDFYFPFFQFSFSPYLFLVPLFVTIKNKELSMQGKDGNGFYAALSNAQAEAAMACCPPCRGRVRPSSAECSLLQHQPLPPSASVTSWAINGVNLLCSFTHLNPASVGFLGWTVSCDHHTQQACRACSASPSRMSNVYALVSGAECLAAAYCCLTQAGCILVYVIKTQAFSKY